MSVDITVNDLIIRAFSSLGIYSPYKIPGGEDLLTGLYHLNELLDYYQIDGIYVPFFKTLEFPLTVGKDTYTIAKTGSPDVTNNPLVELSWCTITYGGDSISYPVAIISYDQYDTFIRNEVAYARPNRVILQRGVDISNLIFFPLPDQTYNCTVRGKFYLSDLQLQDHLSEVPGYYHRFLRYALARELKDIYKADTWDAKQENEYNTILNEIKASSDFALSIDQNPVFGVQTTSSDERIGVIS